MRNVIYVSTTLLLTLSLLLGCQQNQEEVTTFEEVAVTEQENQDLSNARLPYYIFYDVKVQMGKKVTLDLEGFPSTACLQDFISICSIEFIKEIVPRRFFPIPLCEIHPCESEWEYPLPELIPLPVYEEEVPEGDVIFREDDFVYIFFNNREEEVFQEEVFEFEADAILEAEQVEMLELSGNVIPEGVVVPIVTIEEEEIGYASKLMILHESVFEQVYE
ncbi:MAG: hypothetical protein ACFB0B_13475 [Thermonemataceae bacterium]